MSADGWDTFLAGFGSRAAPADDDAHDDHDLFVQLDAFKDERHKRGDPLWVPPGRYPECNERLLREKLARGWRRW